MSRTDEKSDDNRDYRQSKINTGLKAVGVETFGVGTAQDLEKARRFLENIAPSEASDYVPSFTLF